jgi:5'-3' exonuclease
MGIPSYFSHIVKNHREIIKKLLDINYPINNLYIDSNSIVYDCLRKISYKDNDEFFENTLIQQVCYKLEEYIKHIQPNNRVFIALDGVAPVAKLEQQRNRRYKSTMEKKIMKFIDPLIDKSWSSTAITPGTNFMNNLNKGIKDFFHKKELSYHLKQIIFSGSDEVGEGEHKLFSYIRRNEKSHKNETSIIYGLDADLIMLSLNHLPISKHIYLYRETPEFIKSIDRDLNPNESYLLDIPELSKVIISTMNNGRKVNNKQQVNRLYDYIFMCFLLGNDFLPHFPSVNIRTKGIYKLLAAYRNVLGNSNKNLTNGKKIYWDNFYKFIDYLAKEEHNNLKSEYEIRNKMEKRQFPSETIDDKKMRYLNAPILNRCKERYIDPYSYGWENRYYETLFDSYNSKDYVRDVCINYMEGLEWVMKYYTSGCADWRWKYNYNYPPLFADLLRYIPRWDMDLIEENNNKPVTESIQLSYVLPNESLVLLPQKYHIRLLKNMRECYPTDCKLEWSFCKYIWESHVHLPSIDIDKLEHLLNK